MATEPPVTVDTARAHGLTPDEYDTAVTTLGRSPTHPELGVLSAMWSEHCSYKSSRVHLRRLPTQGPRVLQGPGENAGVVDIGNGWCVVFKMESHNHPSFIAPYQGAATGVGGILRDVFTMGARPVALMDSLRFGAADHPRTPALLRGVVRGIAGYGNAIGVPTVAGEISFDPAYNGNVLVNVFALGLCRTDGLFFGRAKGVGNPVLYVGARTGRDGIHGATMASAEFSEGAVARRPTVQVGDPFTEKLLLEACLEIFAADVLEGVQDMGAAGLTSSAVEMASRGGTGIELDLDRIPRRARGLSPYEILLSESQERMVMVARVGCEQHVLDICAKWDLDAVVIGRVTDTRRFVVRATKGYDPMADSTLPGEPGPVVVDLPVDMLTDAAPVYQRPCADDVRPREIDPVDLSALTLDPSADLLDLLGSPNVGSRSWVYRQFDYMVRDGTVVRPGVADAAVVRLFCHDATAPRERYVALAVDCNGRMCALDPRTGAAMAVAEACRNVACTGAEPIGITDCLNFGNPERPEVMAQLRDAIDGIADACRALGVPVVSGNVSLYNETAGPEGPCAVLPTPTIAAVGLLSRPTDVVTTGLKRPGDIVALAGPLGVGALGGGEWLTRKASRLCGTPPTIDLDAEARLQRFLVASARAGLLASAHDCAEGGLLVALAESCIAGNLGASVTLPAEIAITPGGLFGEDPSRVLLSLLPGSRELLVRKAAEHGVPLCFIGDVGGTELGVAGVLKVAVETLAACHQSALASVVGTDA